MSLMAGLVFGGLSAFGAYNITNDPKDIKVSLREYGSLCSPATIKSVEVQCPASVITGCSLSFSVLGSPRSHHGNEIQELWEINASWNNDRAKVRYRRASRQYELLQKLDWDIHLLNLLMQLLLSVLQLVYGVSPLTSDRLTGRTPTFTLETGNIPTKPTKSNFTAVLFFLNTCI